MKENASNVKMKILKKPLDILYAATLQIKLTSVVLTSYVSGNATITAW